MGGRDYRSSDSNVRRRRWQSAQTVAAPTTPKGPKPVRARKNLTQAEMEEKVRKHMLKTANSPSKSGPRLSNNSMSSVDPSTRGMSHTTRATYRLMNAGAHPR